MRTYTVRVFKTHFSEILERVRSGESVAVAFGPKKEVVAYLVPRTLTPGQKRPLGLLEGKAKATFSADFKMTEEELLGL